MLDWLYTPVSWVLLRWHDLICALGARPGGGVGWALSIVAVVVTARLLLLPLFARQAAQQARLRTLQPQLARLRERHRNDRAELQRRTMALQQEHGVGPASGCLPLLASIPIFYALFHVLRHLSNSVGLCASSDTGTLVRLYSFTPAQTCQASQARLFGAPLAGALGHPSSAASWVVTLVVMAVSALAIVGTQALAASRAVTTPAGPAATVQRVVRVVGPGSVLVSAVVLPLGLVIYLMTTNVWNLAQQAYFSR